MKIRWNDWGFVKHTTVFDYCFMMKVESSEFTATVVAEHGPPTFSMAGRHTLKTNTQSKKSRETYQCHKETLLFLIFPRISWWHLFRLAMKGNHSAVNPICLKEKLMTQPTIQFEWAYPVRVWVSVFIARFYRNI